MASNEAPSFTEGEMTALVAPHIDLEAGRRVYSSAYQAIRGISPKRVIILGVGHSMTEGMFSVSEKAFETPLGTLETDQNLVRTLKDSGGLSVSSDDSVCGRRFPDVTEGCYAGWRYVSHCRR